MQSNFEIRADQFDIVKALEEAESVHQAKKLEQESATQQQQQILDRSQQRIKDLTELMGGASQFTTSMHIFGKDHPMSEDEDENTTNQQKSEEQQHHQQF